MSKILFFLITMVKITPMNGIDIQDNPLVEVNKLDSTIMVELIYATDHNFTKRRIYQPNTKAYLHKDAAQALCNAHNELRAMRSKEHPQGIGIRLWDGYRSPWAQNELWQACAVQYPNEKEREQYVANPAKGGGRHPRGTAVDVTLYDIATGKNLPMPTEFDHFGKEAWIDYNNLDSEVKKNRELLAQVMMRHGFTRVKCEWWHFDLAMWAKYPPLTVEI